MGLGVPDHPAARAHRARDGATSSCRATSTRATEPVDHLGGMLSIVLVGALILAINFAVVPNKTHAGPGPRRRRGRWRSSPSSSASGAPRTRSTTCTWPHARPSGWPPAPASSCSARSWARCSSASSSCRTCSATRPSTPGSRSCRRPSSWCSSRRARPSSSRHGAPRFTLLVGYVFVLLGFLTMLLLWKEGIPYWKVGLGYAFVGIGVGLAGTPASHSLTGSVPVTPGRHGLGHRRPAARPRRRHHAVDLRRAADGRLRRRLPAALSRLLRQEASDSTEAELTKSFSSAADTRLALSPVGAGPDHRRREDAPSCRATSGRTRPGSSRSCSAPLSSPSSSRGRAGAAAAPELPERGRRTGCGGSLRAPATAGRADVTAHRHSRLLFPLVAVTLAAAGVAAGCGAGGVGTGTIGTSVTRTLPAVTRTEPTAPTTTETETTQPTTTEEATPPPPQRSTLTTTQSPPVTQTRTGNRDAHRDATLSPRRRRRPLLRPRRSSTPGPPSLPAPPEPRRLPHRPRRPRARPGAGSPSASWPPPS